MDYNYLYVYTIFPCMKTTDIVESSDMYSADEIHQLSIMFKDVVSKSLFHQIFSYN